MLENDAEVDSDIVLPVVKRLGLLHDPEDNPPMKALGPMYMDTIFQNDRPL